VLYVVLCDTNSCSPAGLQRRRPLLRKGRSPNKPRRLGFFTSTSEAKRKESPIIEIFTCIGPFLLMLVLILTVFTRDKFLPTVKQSKFMQ